MVFARAPREIMPIVQKVFGLRMAQSGGALAECDWWRGLGLRVGRASRGVGYTSYYLGMIVVRKAMELGAEEMVGWWGERWSGRFG